MISDSRLKILVIKLYSHPQALNCKILKKDLRQSLIDNQNCDIANCISAWHDSGKYLLSCGIFISSLQQDVYDMTSQNLSILIDFTQTSVPIFQSFF